MNTVPLKVDAGARILDVAVPMGSDRFGLKPSTVYWCSLALVELPLTEGDGYHVSRFEFSQLVAPVRTEPVVDELDVKLIEELKEVYARDNRRRDERGDRRLHL